LALKTDLSCFQDNYCLARQRFLKTLLKLPAGLVQKHQSFRHPLPGPENSPLYMDWLQIGQTETPERVLVLISGTHGVEGFAGAAIQCHWMPELARQLSEDKELGILLVHALNPWGFAWLRRYDHEGIDLNRNFIDFNAPLPANAEYEQLHDDLFRRVTEPPGSVFERWRTKWGALEFESAITRGQYQHADGIFFGGTRASWSRQVIEQATGTAFLEQAGRIAIIDLHTGLGPFGHGEVINDHPPESTGFKLAGDWYGANARSALLGESCSTVKTGLLDYFWHQLIGDRGCFVTLEFGTYSLEKLLSLSCEEQRYHIGYHARELEHPSVVALREYFYPEDESWRELVLFRAGQIINLALEGMRS
jgi:Protein of unknown function (DUF2817)